MEFEEMKMIWDSQNEEPLYAIDQAALHKQVQKRVDHVRYAITFFEWAIILSPLLATAILVIDGIRDGASWPQLLTAGIYTGIGLNAWRMRQRRLRREEAFESSLLGEIDRSISRIDVTINRVRSMVWWYVLPFLAATAIPLYINQRTFWPVGMLVLVFGVSLIFGEWEIRNKSLPEKRNLLSVRALLENG